MKHRYALIFPLLTTGPMALAQGGGCLPPQVSFSSATDEPAPVCQGASITFDGSFSTAALGHVVDQWIWHVGADRDTMMLATATFTFPDPGVFEVTLEVRDETGCSSGESQPMHVLVSATPDFSGTLVPEVACEGQSINLNAVAEQPLMIGNAVACTPPANAMPLIDTPTPPSLSLLQVAGQPNGTLSDIAELGDICLEMEHSYVGDLVLSVTCPNGQSVTLHEQGGGGTFLGDANDDDNGSAIVPGICFQYCFGISPTYGTLAGSTDVAIPVPQGMALPPGRYTSLQPLEFLLGCPLNGTWTLSSSDLFGSDNGYLCGWCISFGEQPDSSFIDQGPVLGSSADSSYWSGPGVANTAGQPGNASLMAMAGTLPLTYTVIDSYGCEYEALFPLQVGANPEVSIVENPELGLVCAQPTGAYTYQWSYMDEVVVGAAGTCFTPPGPGAVSVVVTSVEGCVGYASSVGTGLPDGRAQVQPAISVFPNPNGGAFTMHYNGKAVVGATLRLVDTAGRVMHQDKLSSLVPHATTVLQLTLAPGSYTLEVLSAGEQLHQRIIVQ